MRTQHHLRKPTLLDYGQGRLAAAVKVVAASHISWCRECGKAAEAAATTREGTEQAIHGAPPVEAARRGQTAIKALDRLPAAAESAGELNNFGLPAPLAQRLERGLEAVAWRRVWPGVAVHDIELPPGAAGHLRLVRLAPGKALPEHGHGGRELSLVLRGAYADAHGRYSIGDIADRQDTVHRPLAEDAGCICLVAAETPVRYRSWSTRLWHRLGGL